MEFTAVLINIVGLISEACRNVDRLPAALITSGIVQAAAALALAIFQSPAGIFVGHGKAPFFLYYGILIAVMIFGFVEASGGFYVSGDLTRRRAIGMTILWISILPIVLVAALGGFAIFKAGIFVGHGKAPFFLYYGILIAVMIFGFVEASGGFYVSGDLTRRRAIGMTILWISILPIVLVAALGGFAIFK